jgi:hypothetical protein
VTPEAFITKWRDVQSKARAGAQEHFIDLCRLPEDLANPDARSLLTGF